MATTYKPQHLREDDTAPCLLLAQAVRDRRASGSTHTRAASEEGSQ